MNHCIDCGKRVNTGRTHWTAHTRRCLPCANERTFFRWRYTLSPAQRQRRKAEQEASNARA